MNQEMDNDERVYILESAYRDIISECLNWNGVETGTVLVGCQLPAKYGSEQVSGRKGESDESRHR